MTCSFLPFLAANEKAVPERQKRRGKMFKGASSQRQRATLGSSFGPNDNPKEAVSSAHSARKVRHFRVLGAVMGWRNEKRKHTRASFACAKIQQNGAKCKSRKKNKDKRKGMERMPYGRGQVSPIPSPKYKAAHSRTQKTRPCPEVPCHWPLRRVANCRFEYW